MPRSPFILFLVTDCSWGGVHFDNCSIFNRKGTFSPVVLLYHNVQALDVTVQEKIVVLI